MKIGIMGGTFNPIHIGHLLLAQFAYEEFSLKEIWFLPNGNPPHKQTEEGKKAMEHRIEMVRQAINNVPYFRLCMHEATTVGHSYTYRTLNELKQLYPENEFFFIVGADSLFSIEQWMCFHKIFSNCTLLAAVRDDKDTKDVTQQIQYLKDKYHAKIALLQAPLLEISSTTIRKRAANNLSISYMVPETVAAYINQNELYQTEDKSND